MTRARTAFLWVCWVPAAVWWAAWTYVRLTNQWGAFAAAPLIMGSIALSGVLGLLGFVMVISRLWKRTFDVVLVAATLLAGSVFIYGLQR
jgi:hypothetical protein